MTNPSAHLHVALHGSCVAPRSASIELVMFRRIWRGWLGVAVVAAIAPVLLGAPAPLPQETPATMRVEGSADATCEEDGTLEDRLDDHMALLQTGMLINRHEWGSWLRPVRQAAESSTLQHGHDFANGLLLLCKLLLPFMLLIILLVWSVASWVGFGTSLQGALREASPPEPPKPLEVEVSPPEPPAVEVPQVVLWFCLIGVFMLNVNFTIILPASNKVMVEAGGTTALSGLCIGVYAMGAIFSVPLAVCIAQRSYRVGALCMAALAVVGNLAYAILGSVAGNAGVVGMILARLVCGLEGGAQIIFASAVVQLGSGAGISRATGKLTMSGCLGLILGPALASLSQTCFPHASPEVPPAVVMITAAVVYGTCALWLFPSQAECFKLAGEPSVKDVAAVRDDAACPIGRVRKAWLFQMLACVVSVARLFQRVSWEAGLLLILHQQYGLNMRAGGLLITLPALASMPLLLFVGYLHALGPSGGLRLLALLEIAGMLPMIHTGRPSSASLIALMVGSCLFYGANWMTGIPMTAIRKKYSIPSHWALNVEAGTAFGWGSAYLGGFYGPVVSRILLDFYPSQNLLAMCLITVWLGTFLAVEVGMHVLLRA